MNKLLLITVACVMAACMAACGTSSSSSTSPTEDTLTTTIVSSPVYPAALGGSWQTGAALALNSPVTVNLFSGGAYGFLDYNPNLTTPVAAAYNRPFALTTDGVYLYLADYYNNAIRRINIATREVTTVAGNIIGGSNDGIGVAASFNRPTGVTYAAGSLYVTDSLNYTIRKIDLSTGAVVRVAGGVGQSGAVDGTNPDLVRFGLLNGITTDGISLYVTDSNNTIRRVVIGSWAVTTLAGSPNTTGSENGNRTKARFNQPTGITADGPNLYVADWGNNIIRKITLATGEVTTIAGVAGPGGPAGTNDTTTHVSGETARFNQPNGIVCDGPNLYVADSYHNYVRKIVLTPSGYSGAVTTLTKVGVSVTSNSIVGITSNGSSLFITDISSDNLNHVIRELK